MHLAVLHERGGDRDRWFNTQQIAGCFREFEFREQNNAVLLAQSLLQIIASPVAMESVAIALTQPLVWAGVA